jgi:hypothetical protein
MKSWKIVEYKGHGERAVELVFTRGCISVRPGKISILLSPEEFCQLGRDCDMYSRDIMDADEIKLYPPSQENMSDPPLKKNRFAEIDLVLP